MKRPFGVYFVLSMTIGMSMVWASPSRRASRVDSFQHLKAQKETEKAIPLKPTTERVLTFGPLMLKKKSAKKARTRSKD